MSDPVGFHLQLDVTGNSEAVVTEFCIGHLRERGYAVAPPNEKWETMKEFLARLDTSWSNFRRCLADPRRPHVLIHPSARRVSEILSNAAFDAFVKRHKQPERKPRKRARPSRGSAETTENQ